MLDLVVIGAGLTGLVAALRAVDAGLQVKVVAKGLGALHWSAATIDLLGYLNQEREPATDPWAALEMLPDTHPYGLLGREQVRATMATFQGWTHALGLPYGGGSEAERNFLLPSPVGALRPVYLAPLGQRAGEVGQGQPMLIVGFQDLRDFYPMLLAENLGAQGQPARAILLPLNLLTDRRDFNTAILAGELDDAARQRQLGAAIRQVLQPGERVGLPAILGMHAHTQVMDTLQQITGAPVFEIPALPPSVPGLRLILALRRHLESRNVRVEVGMEVIGFHANEKAIQWVETATSARPLKHRAKRFLLATGGVLGGGFTGDHNGHFREVVFDLPLTVPQDRSQWFRPLFLDPQGQPVFCGGVAVDARLQPVDAQGDIVYTNLWVAGGTLAGADPIQERSLEGIGIATGIAAADSITCQKNG